MKRILKSIFALFFGVLLLFGAASPGRFVFLARAKKIDEFARGDLVTFGWYPQTKVTDSAMVNSLNVQSAVWHSYGYYSGSGSYSDGNMVPSGYMTYTDVTYGGQKYRGVRFSQYRPYYTGLTSSAGSTFQDENGYDQPGSTYWFQWEPLQWRVLDPAAGLVLCETIIDSQPYNNYILYSGKDAYGCNAYWGDVNKTHYANNYAESSLRQWLNDDFCNTAFSLSQQDIIAATTLDNSAYSTFYSAYDSVSTTDRVFLLSFGDMTNPAYGFDADEWTTDPARQAQGSDYAKCQGLYVDTSNEFSRWWLRSAGYYSDLACSVEYDGWLSDYYYGTSNSNFGIRPAFRLNLTSEVFQSSVSEVGSGGAVKRVAVSFRPAGGECDLASKTVTVNEAYGELPVPSRSGYWFAGWFTAAEGGTQVTADSEVTAAQDHELFAHWKLLLTASVGSQITIDRENGFLYGIHPAFTANDFKTRFVNEENSIIIADGIVTTASVIRLMDGDTILEELTAVLFGDIDGNGWYDGTDAYFVSLVANGMISENALTAAQRMAADCNHDGAIDSADAALLEQAGLLLESVDQSLSSEKFQANSACLVYDSLIDQSIEITEPDQSAATEPPVAEQWSAASVRQVLLDLFKRLVSFVTMIFSIIMISK